MSSKNKILHFIVCLLLSSGKLFSQTYTFTPCGATGRYGPNQTQVTNTYSNTALNGQVTTTNGIQSWTVPTSGIYRIEANGAKGGSGQVGNPSTGARMQGDFILTAGQVLKICVGQVGGNGGISGQGGGGGGSFVTDINNTPLIIAGGGGGAAINSTNSANNSGSSGTSGMLGSNGNASVIASSGGSSGSGGGVCTTYTIGQGSGGGGLTGNGTDGNPSTGGLSYVNGATGGAGASSTSGIAGDGGFGGGGGADWSNHLGAGGGGGYSGGGGGTYYGYGGGGGSYNSGLDQVNTSSVNAGDGYVLVKTFFGINFVQTASISCNGQLTAALTASANSGIGPYTYTWSPVASNATLITGLGAGTYTCRTTDVNSRVYTNTFVITQPSAITVTSSYTNALCNGIASGKAQAFPTGGTGPFTYSWTPSIPFSNIHTVQGLAAGSYTCLIKDALNCTATSTFLISQPPPVIVTVAASNTEVCTSQSVVLTASGALTYTWNHGVINGVAFTPTNTSGYSMQGINATGCYGYSNINVYVKPSPTVNVIVSSSTLCAGNSVTLSASGADSYSWSTSATTESIVATPTITNVYSVTGSYTNGCQHTAVKTLTVFNLTVNANASSFAVCMGNTLSLYGSGATTYTWSHGLSNNVTFTPSSTDAYTVNGTGVCGTASAVIGVTVLPLPSVNAGASSTLLCTGFTLSLSGSGALSYSWPGSILNGVPFTVNTGSTYVVSGTDINGCKNTAAVSISVNPLPLVTSSVSSATVCAGNTVILNGGGATSYAWTGGVMNNTAFVPSGNNSYTVTGTDLNGCQNTAVTEVTVITAPTVSAHASSTAVCAGNTISLYGSGASSYVWSGTVTNASTFVPSSSASYTVYGSNACFTSVGFIAITVHTLPLITANTTSNSVCQGNTLSLFGGGGNSYAWSGGVINNLAFIPSNSATYVVTGTNGHGCQNTATIAITVNARPVVTLTASNPVICSGGTVILTASGADQYTLSPLVTPGVPFALASTSTYSVIGTNTLTGCTNTNISVQTITVNPLPSVSALSSATAVCLGDALILTGTGADTFNWTAGVPNGLPFFPNTSSVVTVTGTSTLTGCSNSVSVAFTVNPLPSLTVTASGTAVCAGQTVSLLAGGADTYTWSNAMVNGSPFVPPSNQTYTVMGTNTLTGCSDTEMQNVVVKPLPLIVLTISTNSVVCSGNTVVIYANGADTYTFSGGISSGVSFSPALSSTYSVQGTNTVTGCSSTITALQGVLVNPLPTLSVNGNTNTICVGESATLTVSGALNYTWNTGDITPSIFISPGVATAYTVTGTDGNGCVNTISVDQQVSECTSIKELLDAALLKIFPNPNNGSFTMSGSAGTQINIWNELGQNIKTINLDSNGKCNISELPNGIYFVIGQKNNSTLRQKIIVAK